MKRYLITILLAGFAAHGSNRESGRMMVPAAFFINFGKVSQASQSQAFKAYTDYVRLSKLRGHIAESTEGLMPGTYEKLVCVRYNDYWKGLAFVDQLTVLQNKYKSFDVYVAANCENFDKAHLIDLNESAE